MLVGLFCFALFNCWLQYRGRAWREARLLSPREKQKRQTRGEAGREKSIRQYLKIYLLGPGGPGDFNVIPSLRCSLESEKRKGYLLFLDP